MNSLQNCENQKEFINYINFQPLCDVTEFFLILPVIVILLPMFFVLFFNNFRLFSDKIVKAPTYTLPFGLLQYTSGKTFYTNKINSIFYK